MVWGGGLEEPPADRCGAGSELNWERLDFAAEGWGSSRSFSSRAAAALRSAARDHCCSSIAVSAARRNQVSASGRAPRRHWTAAV